MVSRWTSLVHFDASGADSKTEIGGLWKLSGAFGDLKGEGGVVGVVALEESDLGLGIALVGVEGLEFAAGLVGGVGIEADGLIDAGDF